MGIIGLSLSVSLTAVLTSLVIGLPLGALLASYRFPGRTALIVISNTFLGMPPVVIGLLIYLLIRAPGHSASWASYTPAAMMLAQTVLVMPISIALSRQALKRPRVVNMHRFFSLLDLASLPGSGRLYSKRVWR